MTTLLGQISLIIIPVNFVRRECQAWPIRIDRDRLSRRPIFLEATKRKSETIKNNVPGERRS